MTLFRMQYILTITYRVLYSLYWVFFGGVQKKRKKGKKERLWLLMYRPRPLLQLISLLTLSNTLHK